MVNSLEPKANQLYFEDKKYLQATLNQIQRDFDMSGVIFEGSTIEIKNYQELFKLVLENLIELIEANNIQFKNLLYRIDVPEVSIHKRMASESNQNFADVVCSLIIERCLLKVLTREKFSK